VQATDRVAPTAYASLHLDALLLVASGEALAPDEDASGALARWNDREGRTVEEVFKVIAKAAALADAEGA
jgi:hypothetical protein